MRVTAPSSHIVRCDPISTCKGFWCERWVELKNPTKLPPKISDCRVRPPALRSSRSRCIGARCKDDRVSSSLRKQKNSLTARAADVSLRLPPSRWLLAGARPPPGPSPRSPAPADHLLRGAPGAGSVSFDPEAGVVTGLTRDRDSRSENRCSMCSAIHISSRTSLRPSSTREPSDPPPRVVLTFVR